MRRAVVCQEAPAPLVNGEGLPIWTKTMSTTSMGPASTGQAGDAVRDGNLITGAEFFGLETVRAVVAAVGR